MFQLTKVRRWLKEPANYVYLVLMVLALIFGTLKYGLLATVTTFLLVALIGWLIGLVLRLLR